MIKKNRHTISKVKELIKDTGIKKISFDIDTSKLTSLLVGGRCFCFVVVDSREELKEIISICLKNEIKVVAIGSGTNILFNDNYLDLMLVKLGRNFDYLRLGNDDEIMVGAAYKLSKFVNKTGKWGFDFSFLAGIPGTSGGGISGNSGDRKQGICSFVKKIRCIMIKKNVFIEKDINITTKDFGYRFFSVPNLLVITDIILKSEKLDRRLILEKIRNKTRSRKLSQPTNTKNAGCFFKNPDSFSKSAGEMIDRCGLKGFIYGGARVSKKHANFIENFKNANAEDIAVLSRIVKSMVKERYGIELEYEVRMIGF